VVALRLEPHGYVDGARRFSFGRWGSDGNRCSRWRPASRCSGLGGIERGLSPGDPIDQNLYELPPERLADIPTVPTSLDQALDALADDHATCSPTT
jgi:glutamine synthetase